MSTATSSKRGKRPSAAVTQEVNTKQVTGRRTLRFNSFDDLLADAEKMASTNTKTLGNWSLGQILKHLAVAINVMIDGSEFMMPAPVRLVMRLLMKKKMLSSTLSPGFKLPAKVTDKFVAPSTTTTEEGLEALRAAIQRVKGTNERAPHGAFGKLTQKEWDEFQLRHCEMHMSFVVPA